MKCAFYILLVYRFSGDEPGCRAEGQADDHDDDEGGVHADHTAHILDDGGVYTDHAAHILDDGGVHTDQTAHILDDSGVHRS